MDWTKEKYTAEEVEEESAFLVAHSLSRGLLPPCLLLLPSFNQRKGIASCNYTDTPQKGNKAPTNQHLSCSQTLIRVKYSKLLCKSKWPIKNRQWRSILNLFSNLGKLKLISLLGPVKLRQETDSTNQYPRHFLHDMSTSPSHWPSFIMSISYWFITISCHTWQVIK